MNLARKLAVIVFLGTSPLALAHTQDGSLGGDAAATDYYQVTCSDDGSGPPSSMMAQLLSRGPTAAAVTAVVHRGTTATSTSDAAAGDASASPLVFVNGGDGVYNVFVSKAGSGSVNYTLTYHCMTGANGGGLHTGTTIVFRQNQ